MAINRRQRPTSAGELRNALRRALEEDQRQKLLAEASRKEALRFAAEAEARRKADEDANRRVEEETRRRVAKVLLRRSAEHEARLLAEQEAWRLATEALGNHSITIGGAVNLEMVRVPAGKFTMGSPDNEVAEPAMKGGSVR